MHLSYDLTQSLKARLAWSTSFGQVARSLPIPALIEYISSVVTLEPGCYRPGFGGCRLEDLVLVTDDGAELLTNFPYDLEP